MARPRSTAAKPFLPSPIAAPSFLQRVIPATQLMTVEELKLSRRALNRLRDLGVSTVDELIEVYGPNVADSAPPWPQKVESD